MEGPDPETGSTCGSLRSDHSMVQPITFTREMEKCNPGPSPDCVSLKSDHSMVQPIAFTQEINKAEPDPSPDCVSLKSDHSMDDPPTFSDKRPTFQTQEEPSPDDLHSDAQLNTVFKQLEENIITFVKEEMKMFCRAVHVPTPLASEDGKEKSREALLEITLDFLKRMKQEELAQNLQSSFSSGVTQCALQSTLQQKFQSIFEGIPKAGNPTPLNQIYTELHIKKGGAAGVSKEHEVRWIESTSRKQVSPDSTIACEDIFKASAKRDRRISKELTNEVNKQTQVRTVLTLGVAGIGKTVLTQKFCLDWAEGKANQDIHQLFPFTFRELNGLKDKTISLEGLVQHFINQSIKLRSGKNLQTVFIFDGLDECRFPLDFTQTLTDPTEPSSVGVLVANLIKGSLLPFARVWFTTRPAAANQIPADCVSMVTEVEGFTDLQREQYFMKRFSEEEATVVISHIKKSRCLYAMCRIPVFSWIIATVLEHVIQTGNMDQLPNTLTEMYVHFLVVQVKFKGVKYDDKSETDPVWSLENQTMVLSLGKLAFEQLKEGNLIFYESDLVECGLDVEEASIYSGVFTQVFREVSGLHLHKVYSFVHLSVQEFLAALHVHVTFVNYGINLLQKQDLLSFIKSFFRSPDLFELHQTAVDKALQNPNGHWDLFLRFLLGLSQQNNRLLRGLLRARNNEDICTVRIRTSTYIISQMKDEALSAEVIFNLFHCLNEVGDNSLVELVQARVKEKSFSRLETPIALSALTFILLSSNKDLSVFDLKKYCTSEEAFIRLQPLVQEATTAILTYSDLSWMSCRALSSTLSCQNCLRLLDLTNNDLQDSGVEELCLGFKSPECRLETLRLSGCLVSEEGGAFLVSALNSTSSCLKELDLSYNHPGTVTTEKLSALQNDPSYSLELLRVDPSGEQFLTPGLQKYSCELALEPNTAHKSLELSEDNRTVTFLFESDQPCSDHPERFHSCRQVLCSTGLTGRCYWEVDWGSGQVNWEVDVAVSYRTIGRKGGSGESGFGLGAQSWCLRISNAGYSVLHDGIQTSVSSSYYCTDRVAVYLDYPAGSLSFYKIDNDDELLHLHTFTTTFTEPVYVGLGFGLWSSGMPVSFDHLGPRHYSTTVYSGGREFYID